MTVAPEAVVQDLLKVYSAGDLDATVAFFSEDAVYTDGSRGRHEGVGEIRAALAPMMSVAPRVVRNVRTMASRDGTVILERVDTFEYEGRTIRYEIAVAFDVNSDGLITRWRDYYDMAEIRGQMLTGTVTD